ADCRGESFISDDDVESRNFCHNYSRGDRFMVNLILHESEYRPIAAANNWETGVFVVGMRLSGFKRFSYALVGPTFAAWPWRRHQGRAPSHWRPDAEPGSCESARALQS